MQEINRTDLTILSILKMKNATNKFDGITISEILDSESDGIPLMGGKARMTVYRRLRGLNENGFVGKGALDNHADTFYLMGRGESALKGDF